MSRGAFGRAAEFEIALRQGAVDIFNLGFPRSPIPNHHSSSPILPSGITPSNWLYSMGWPRSASRIAYLKDRATGLSERPRKASRRHAQGENRSGDDSRGAFARQTPEFLSVHVPFYPQALGSHRAPPRSDPASFPNLSRADDFERDFVMTVPIF